MSDLVSVIIPSFDRGHVVREAVDSVLGQLHGHVEVIVVDDGSSDATREIVETAYGAEPRVRHRYQPNAGASSARNTGLDLATGDYVAFLDSMTRGNLGTSAFCWLASSGIRKQA